MSRMCITHLRLFLTCLCLLVIVCNTSPTSNGHLDQSNLDKRQSSSPFAITGLQAKSGTGVRLEIRELRKNNAQWNLFLLALNKFYARDQTTLTSYYQISGIHGRPYAPWNGVNFAPGAGGGYCTHSSTLFPTWHRPYLAMYEQIIWDLVQEVATSIGTNEYKTAAKTFRIPYWDWAAPVPNGQHVLPSTVGGSPFIVISLPSGTKTIDNPLYRYHFHPLKPADFPDNPFSKWEFTLRYPISQDKSAHSQNNLVSLELDNSQVSFSKRFMNLLENYQTYSHFSNEAWFPNNPGSYDSLESLHDQIHGLVGTNGGHMAYIDYSAFDPIFWLHHTNVDRLFAIWQAIYPNSFVQSGPAKFGTATIRAGDIIDQNTPLKPFHKDTAGNFWTSSSSRQTSTFGYNYPETQNKNIAAVKRAVNALYGKSAGQIIKRRDSNEDSKKNQNLSSSIKALFRRSNDVEIQPTGLNTYTEWISNIRVSQNALPGTFFIHIFLGDFTSDSTRWPLDKNLVGTHTVFTKINGATNDLIVTGTIPLTQALQRDADAGKFDMANNKSVEDYLTKNLHWRVTNVEGTDINRDQVANLKVSVVSCLVKEAISDSHFPTWSPCITRKDVTDGRPAGLGDGEPV